MHEVVAECEQRAAQGGDAGREREGVDLGARHADAERGRRPLVRADGEEPSSGATPAEVGDHERRQR